MTLPTLKEKPGFTGQLVQQLTDKLIPAAGKSINTMISTYTKEKQSMALASALGFDEEQSEIFSKLPTEFQKVMIEQRKKQMEPPKSKIADIDKMLGESAKDYTPQEKSPILEEVWDLEKQGVFPQEAQRQGVLNFLKKQEEEDAETAGEKLKKALTEKKGGFLQAIMGEAEPRTEGAAIAQEPGAATTGFLEGVGKIGELISGPSIDPAAFIKKGKVERKRLKKETKAEKTAREEGGRIGGRLATGAMAVDLALSLPRWGFQLGAAGLRKFAPNILKNLQKFASKEGLSASETATKFRTEAVEAGIDIEKAATDVKEGKKVQDLAERISAEPKEAARIEKAARARKEFPKEAEVKPAKRKPLAAEKEVQLREAKLKEFPKNEAEIEELIAKKVAEKEKLAKGPATERGKINLQARKDAGAALLPQAEKNMTSAYDRLRALEIARGKAPASQKGMFDARIKFAEQTVEEVESAVRAAINNKIAGASRISNDTLRKAAFDKIEGFKESIVEGKEIKLTKADYNPERVKLANKYRRSKEVPGRFKEDYHERVHRLYEDMYGRELGKVTNELNRLRKAKKLANTRKIRNLEKEQEVLKKVVEHNRADRIIHQRNLRLRKIGKSKRVQDLLKKDKNVYLQEPKGTEKAQRVYNDKIKNLVENPTPENLAKVAEETGVKSENLRKFIDETKEEAKSWWRKRFGEPRPRTRRGMRELKEFAKIFKKNKLDALLKTPLGNSLLLNSIAAGIEEVTGEKIPYSKTMITLAVSRSLPARIAAITIDVIQKHLVRPVQQRKMINEYRQADEKKRIELRKKMPRKLLTKARERR